VSTLAQPARADVAAPAPARRRPARPRPATRPLAGGVVWIVLLGVLLAGVVAVNVAVLQLNVKLDELGRERVSLRADVARLRAELSSAGANARIESRARALGLEPADGETTAYVELAPR
jgi:cell division protein FtsL